MSRCNDGKDDGLGGVLGDAVAVVAVPKSARRELVRQSRYLCELTVVDPFFSSAPLLTVAHAAVLVSMDLLRFPAAALSGGSRACRWTATSRRPIGASVASTGSVARRTFKVPRSRSTIA